MRATGTFPKHRNYIVSVYIVVIKIDKQTIGLYTYRYYTKTFALFSQNIIFKPRSE